MMPMFSFQTPFCVMLIPVETPQNVPLTPQETTPMKNTVPACPFTMIIRRMLKHVLGLKSLIFYDQKRKLPVSVLDKIMALRKKVIICNVINMTQLKKVIQIAKGIDLQMARTFVEFLDFFLKREAGKGFIYCQKQNAIKILLQMVGYQKQLIK